MASLGEVGQRLKQAREAQGLSLAEVASRTRITVRHLRAIEEGTESELPEVFYVRGFLKKYAEVVGLSPTDVADFYKPAPTPTAPLPDLRQGNGQLGYYAAIAAILLGLLLLAWYFQPRVSVVEAPPASPGAEVTDASGSAAVGSASGSEALVAPSASGSEPVVAAVVPASEPVTAASPALSAEPAVASSATAEVASPAPSAPISPTPAATASPEPTPSATPKPTTVALTLALKERSWIEVRVGGRLVKEGISARGEMHRFKGREIEVSAGNAGGVVIFRNGRELGPLGAHGEVVTRVFKP